MEDLLRFLPVQPTASDPTPRHVLSIPAQRHDDPLWTGLWERGYPDGEGNPHTRYGINNSDLEVFYLLRLLAWVLTSGTTRVVCPTYYRDQAAAALGRRRESALMVRWQYVVDEEEDDLVVADRGYAPAHSCIPLRPAPDPWEAAHADRAGLFPVERFDELISIGNALSHDACSDITLYGLNGPARVPQLVDALNAPDTPVVSGVLQPDEFLVTLTLLHDSHDTGASRLIVRCHGDDELDHRLDAAAARARDAWLRYRQAVPHLTTWEHFHRAMADVTAPFLDALTPHR